MKIPFAPIELLLKAQPNQVIYFPNREMAMEFLAELESFLSDRTEAITFQEEVDYVISPMTTFFVTKEDAIKWALE